MRCSGASCRGDVSTSARLRYHLNDSKDVPQPVVVLLEILLEKDPAQRFQTPNELLKVIPAVHAGRRGEAHHRTSKVAGGFCPEA